MRRLRFVLLGFALFFCISQQTNFASAGLMYSYMESQQVKKLFEQEYDQDQSNVSMQINFTDPNFNIDSVYEATLDYYDGDGVYNFNGSSSATFRISGFKLIGMDALTMEMLTANLEISSDFISDFRFRSGNGLIASKSDPFSLDDDSFLNPDNESVDSVEIRSDYDNGYQHFEFYKDQLEREVKSGSGADYRNVKNPTIAELQTLYTNDPSGFETYLDGLTKGDFFDVENKAFSAFTLRLAPNQGDFSRFIPKQLAFTVDWDLTGREGKSDGFILGQRIASAPDAATVPEPSSIAIFGLGAAGLVLSGVRRRQKARNL